MADQNLQKAEIGLIGLAVMGENLALNIESKGFRISVFNRTISKVNNFIDGKFTLGENIGDLGGIEVAYYAYKQALNGQAAPVIDDLTGDQRFFLAFAQSWRTHRSPDLALQLLKIDPHSPPKYRVNGIVRNVDAWYAAFDVKPEHDLYLAKSERVSIW